MENSGFEGFVRDLGYQGDVSGTKYFSEGGCFVLGENFIFVSDIFEKTDELFEAYLKFKTGLDVPFNFFPSVSTTYNGHIDLDYQIVDPLKLIYYRPNKGEECKKEKAIETLEQIADLHDYRLRAYCEGIKLVADENVRPYLSQHSEGVFGLDDVPLGDPSFTKLIKTWHGINSIVNGNSFFTFYVDSSERNFLEGNGMEVVEIPSGMLDLGAGLRCVYGELDLE